MGPAIMMMEVGSRKEPKSKIINKIIEKTNQRFNFLFSKFSGVLYNSCLRIY